MRRSVPKPPDDVHRPPDRIGTRAASATARGLAASLLRCSNRRGGPDATALRLLPVAERGRILLVPRAQPEEEADREEPAHDADELRRRERADLAALVVRPERLDEEAQ